MPDPVNPLGRFDLPFAEQIDFFRRKTNLGTQAWTDIWEAQHDRSFVVAGAMKADLLNEIRQAVDKAIATGTTLETFRKEFRDITDRLGWPGTAGAGSKGGFNWRTKVIYETNLRTSYAAGREAQLADPGLQALLPFRRYVHNDSVLHPRPLHLAWNGLTLPHDHPFWQTHSPPNGWGCRCRVTAVAAPKKGDATKPPPGWDDMDAETGAPPGIDKGWGYAPGASVREELRALVEQKVAKLPGPLGKALAADVEKALTPTSESIGRFLHAPRTGVANDAVAEAVQAIDRVHSAEGLPRIPVFNADTKEFQGRYKATADGDAREIRISSSSKNPGLTALHEIGHFIDHQSLNGKKGFASISDPIMQKVRSTIAQTAAIDGIRAELFKTSIQGLKNLCRYYLKPEEQWARAYAQYIATRSGNASLIGQLDAIRNSAHRAYRNSQWSDDDFAPVAAAIDDLLEELGLKR